MIKLLPQWREDPCKVHVRHHDHRDEATEGPRYGLVLLPEKVIFKLERKCLVMTFCQYSTSPVSRCWGT